MPPQPPNPESPLSLIRTLRAVLIAVVIGVSVGTVLLLGLRALRTPNNPPASTIIPITLGTADHWRRIDSIANIVDVQAFSDNSIWALFAGGAIGRLDNDQWTLMPDNVMGDSMIELPGTKPSVLLVGSAVWQTTDRGASWQAIDLGAAFAANKTTLLASVNGTGDVWVASETALAHYAKGNWATVDAPPGSTLLPMQGMLAARDGSLWITLSKKGVPSALAHYCLDDQWNTWESAEVRPRTESRLIEDSKVGVWFATTNGTAYCDGQKIVSYTFARMNTGGTSIRSDVMLESGLIDQRGGVWWMAANRQVFQFVSGTWQTYIPGDLNFPVSQAGVQQSGSLIADKEGNIWVGGDVLARFKDGQWQTFDPVNGEPFNGLMEKLYITYGRPLARNGDLWFGVSAAGVVRYDGRSWTWFGPQNNALKMPVTAKIHDSYLPLASTSDGGVLLYQTFEHAVYRYIP